jgi:hypothetical protein
LFCSESTVPAFSRIWAGARNFCSKSTVHAFSRIRAGARNFCSKSTVPAFSRIRAGARNFCSKRVRLVQPEPLVLNHNMTNNKFLFSFLSYYFGC